jgi:hypothetical protein
MHKHMKLPIAFASIFAFVLLNSCHSGNAASSPEVAAIGGSGSGSVGTDAVFSYTLQGKKIAGGPVDVILVSNIAYIEKSGQTTNVQFFLNDGMENNSSNFAHSLRFAVPAKTGTIQLTAGDDNGHVELFVSTGSESKYTIYGNESFTVTVGDISATHVSGTFSGKMKAASAPGDELTIADGKFDIPVGKAAK